MIVLITYEEVNKHTKKKEILVSHGIDTDTFSTVVLPSLSPDSIGYFNHSMQEWVLK